MVRRLTNMGPKIHSMLNSKLCHLPNGAFIIILLMPLRVDPSEIRSQSFRLEEDDTGDRACARSSPYRRITSVRSSVSCSSQCSLDADCGQFNFRSGKQVCELFNRSAVTLELEASDDDDECVHYVNNMVSCLISSLNKRFATKFLFLDTEMLRCITLYSFIHGFSY